MKPIPLLIVVMSVAFANSLLGQQQPELSMEAIFQRKLAEYCQDLRTKPGSKSCRVSSVLHEASLSFTAQQAGRPYVPAMERLRAEAQAEYESLLPAWFASRRDADLNAREAAVRAREAAIEAREAANTVRSQPRPGTSVLSEQGETTIPNHAALEPITLSVLSVPTGADIFINGVKKGTTPLRVPVLPGTVELKIQKEGFKPSIGTVQIGPEAIVPYMAKLEAIPN